MLIGNSFLALATVVPALATTLEIATPLDLAAGVDGNGAGPLAVAAAVLRQPTAHATRDLAPSPHKNADLGALTLRQRQTLIDCPETCAPGFFGYCKGKAIGPETCGENCCIGNNACYQFTGCVKGDGSCSGDTACYYSSIPSVENSCKGSQSCKYIGMNLGSVFKGDGIIDSCNAQLACDSVGMAGTLGTITGSCNMIEACTELAYNGYVGSITQSCNGYEACKKLAHTSGYVGSMTKSCNADQACVHLADTSLIASITKTCNNAKHTPCAIIGAEVFGMFGHMTKFVHAETGEKHTRASIEFIADCMNACDPGNGCNGIKWKEHSGTPCRFFGGDISENPCNGRNVCISM